MQIQRPHRGRPSRSGFSLIETVIALLLVAVIAAPITSLALQAMYTDRQTQVTTAAYQAARQELMTLRARQYVNRTATSSPQSFTLPTAVTSAFPDVSLRGDYVIADKTSTYGDVAHPIQQIAVRVSWQNAAAQGGTTSSVCLDTLAAQEPGT